MSKLNQWILNFAVLASCFSISGFKIETLLNHANSDVRNEFNPVRKVLILRCSSIIHFLHPFLARLLGGLQSQQ